ncbi:polysaccharide deacetylase family protein [Magnetospira sp. QH-2]|uniref:polysaccharide deacetylase family protein n=1 Tax=Magnetospira sp. (strain QH-2) TaxID=1288970 RepID=UPI0003E81C3A|nr:polysaccharide deacetylase family protein [Magnetospira sp. QH-2]CCQ75371.1 putative xylanase/chitin deacetylase [Magnetospira sp. QH-2]
MIRARIAPAWLAAWRGTALLRPRPPQGAFRILLLHDIPTAHQGDFAALVRKVKQTHGVIGPVEAERRLSGQLPEHDEKTPPFLITFDDGFASNYRVAEEILNPLGIRAIFFICPKLIELDGQAQREAIATKVFRGQRQAEDLSSDQRLMNWQELQQLSGQGHVIGAHGQTHHNLSDLSGTDLVSEIAGSGQILSERLGRPVEWYAYAFGGIQNISSEALGVIGAHFKYCRSGVRGCNNIHTHPHGLRADQVDPGDTRAWQDLSMEGGLDFRYREARDRLDALAK